MAQAHPSWAPPINELSLFDLTGEPVTEGREAEDCIICAELLYTPKDVIEITNSRNIDNSQINGCHHRYHAECLRKWCANKQMCECPICRRNFRYNEDTNTLTEQIKKKLQDMLDPNYIYLCELANAGSASLESFNLILDENDVRNYININGCNNSRETLLHVIATKSYSLALNKLLANGANPNIKNFEGNTPLNNAIISRENGILLCIIPLLKITNLNIQNNVGDTAFHILLKNKTEGLIMTILSRFNKGAFNPNIQNSEGNTLLHIAAERNMDHVVQTLLLMGAKKNIKNNNNKTPSEIAEELGYIDVSALTSMNAGKKYRIKKTRRKKNKVKKSRRKNQRR